MFMIVEPKKFMFVIVENSPPYFMFVMGSTAKPQRKIRVKSDMAAAATKPP